MNWREIWSTLLEFYPARYWLVYLPTMAITMIVVEGMFIYAWITTFGVASFWALVISIIAGVAAAAFHKEGFDPYAKYDHLET